MKKGRIVIATISVSFALASSGAFAADSCPAGCPTLPKNMRAVSATFNLGAYPANMLTATLAKGVKKRILVVEAMLSNAGFGPIVLPAAVALAANVGALVLEPLPGGATAMEDTGVFRADGDPDSGYTVVGQWWADLDDPFYASLLGVPFTVTVAGGDLSGGPAIGTPCLMSITVRLEKK